MTKPSPDERLVDDGLLLVCGLAWATGLIHIQASVGHRDKSLLIAILLALVATAQFVWGAAVYRAPGDARLLWIGAAGSLIIAAAWGLSRTAGVPIGPEHWDPEPIGLIDSLATTDEIALAWFVIRGSRASGAEKWAGLVLLLLSSLSLVSGPGHVD